MEGRSHTFDIMKGVGIILMIVGHCSIHLLFVKIIYSFHMPLFFIISGFFYKPRPVVQQLKTDFKRLIIPYLFTCILLIICGFIKDLVQNTGFGNTKYYAIASLWGKAYSGSILLTDLPIIGTIWFLLALFWCRMYSSFIFKKQTNGIYIMLTAIIAISIDQFVLLPFGLHQGLYALLFYYAGYLANKHRILEKKIPVFIQFIMGAVWIYCILYSHIEMSLCSYGCYPIDILRAISGCYFIYVICKYINDKNLAVKNILILFGQLSLVILCFHSIDRTVIPDGIWKSAIREIFNLKTDITSHLSIIAVLLIIYRLIWAFAAVFFVPKITFCRRIFSIK
ncbi:MAG: acyltransferase family protein [Dysgonamonadaceae bacterium]|nr:acyltransferase family protein [Dysgonamonadaceae bacterium]